MAPSSMSALSTVGPYSRTELEFYVQRVKDRALQGKGNCDRKIVRGRPSHDIP